MEKFAFYTQYLVIGLYSFNTLAYLCMGQWNKTIYWLGAVLLCLGVLRMK